MELHDLAPSRWSKTTSLILASDRALLEQDNQAVMVGTHPMTQRERASLEQEEEPDLGELFDGDWIIEFRRSTPPVIGLAWGGSVESILREAG